MFVEGCLVKVKELDHIKEEIKGANGVVIRPVAHGWYEVAVVYRKTTGLKSTKSTLCLFLADEIMPRYKKFRVTIRNKHDMSEIESVLIEAENDKGILLKGKFALIDKVKFNKRLHEISYCEV